MDETKYIMRVVRGAFVDPKILDELGTETIENLEGDDWISIDKLCVSLDEIREMQKKMIRHFNNTKNPWYMDGYKEKDKNQLIVAFGADDGNNGKIFQFGRNEKDEIKKVVNYGISKGIPEEQMDFYKIDF